MVHFIRQWGGTLAWNAELPLPLPLQFDEIPGGCRLGFVRVNDGAVQLVRPFFKTALIVHLVYFLSRLFNSLLPLRRFHPLCYGVHNAPFGE
jgi:hypothetical protein